MFDITFYRFEPTTKEDMEKIYNGRILGFLIKKTQQKKCKNL